MVILSWCQGEKCQYLHYLRKINLFEHAMPKYQIVITHFSNKDKEHIQYLKAFKLHSILKIITLFISGNPNTSKGIMKLLVSFWLKR